MSPSWRLEFLGGSWIVGKLVYAYVLQFSMYDRTIVWRCADPLCRLVDSIN